MRVARRRALLGLACLLCAGLLASTLWRVAERGRFTRPFSSYGSGAQGARALYVLLSELGYPILGTSAKAIAMAEDRDLFRDLCQRLQLAQPKNAIVSDLAHAESAALGVGFPVLVRPSYVLGGGGMEIGYWLSAMKDRFNAL